MLYPNLQSSLFKYSFNDSGCTMYQTELLFNEGLLSFNPEKKVEYQDYEIQELKFLKVLYFDSGLPVGLVRVMLSKLQKPYSFSFDQIYWDHGVQEWKYLPQDNREYVAENIKDIIIDNFEDFLAFVDDYEYEDLSYLKEELDNRLKEIEILKLKPKKCPKCGSNVILKIEYGEPSLEAYNSSPDIYFAGCCMLTPAPEWHCKKCHWQWGKKDVGEYCEDDIEDEDLVINDKI